MPRTALLPVVCCWLAILACTPEASPPPSAREVTGDVTVIGEADLTELRGVARIDGSLIIRRSSLDRLELPELMEVTGSLRVEKNPRLGSVGMVSLASMGRGGGGGGVTVENNGALADLDLRSLVSAPGGLAIRANPELARIDLATLESAAGPGIEIAGAFGVSDLDLGRLASTTRLVIESCQRLVRIDLRALSRTDAVWIVANPSLRKIVLPPATAKSETAPDRRPGGADKIIRVRHNDDLPNCEAHRLRDRLIERGFGGTAKLCDNKQDTCPSEGCSDPAHPARPSGLHGSRGNQ